jgi:hypothetical protein
MKNNRSIGIQFKQSIQHAISGISYSFPAGQTHATTPKWKVLSGISG